MSDFQQNGSSVQFKTMGRFMSERNIAHAKEKDESAPEAVPLVFNIEKIRPKWGWTCAFFSKRNWYYKLYFPFSSKLIVATPDSDNIPAQEDMGTDTGEDTSAHGIFPCSQS